MTSLVLYGLLAVLVAGALFLIAAYLLPAGEQIAPPIRDEPIWELPDERRLASDDVATVRLPVALRGYRFAETDLLLDRLGEEIRSRDEEIARLRAEPPAPVSEVSVAPGSGATAGPSGESAEAWSDSDPAHVAPEVLTSAPAEVVEPAPPDVAATRVTPVEDEPTIDVITSERRPRRTAARATRAPAARTGAMSMRDRLLEAQRSLRRPKSPPRSTEPAEETAQAQQTSVADSSVPEDDPTDDDSLNSPDER